jgi:polyisoprenoid-binding protein YceI
MTRTIVISVAALLAAAASVPAADNVHRVAPDKSRLTVRVGTAGLLKMFGHDHVIEARRFTGAVDWNGESPGSSKFSLEIEAASLAVADEELSEKDRAQVQSDMETKALALPDHARISFQSTKVTVGKTEAGRLRLNVSGTLNLRGVEKSINVPVDLSVTGDRLTAAGKMKLESGNWGVPQISAAGGSVKTKQELEIEFEIVAVRE